MNRHIHQFVAATFILLLLSSQSSAQCVSSSINGTGLVTGLVSNLLLAVLSLLFPPVPGTGPANDYSGVGLGVTGSSAYVNSAYSIKSLLVGPALGTADAASVFSLGGQYVDLHDINECNSVSALSEFVADNGGLYAHIGFQVAGKLTQNNTIISGTSVRSDTRPTASAMLKPFRIFGAWVVDGNSTLDNVTFNLLNSQNVTVVRGSKLVMQTGAIIHSNASNLVNVVGELQMKNGTLSNVVLSVPSGGTLRFTGPSKTSSTNVTLTGLLDVTASSSADLSDNSNLDASTAGSTITMGSNSLLNLGTSILNLAGSLSNAGGLLSVGALRGSSGSLVTMTGGNISVSSSLETTSGSISVNGGSIAAASVKALTNSILNLVGAATNLAVTGTSTITSSAFSVTSGAVATLADVLSTAGNIAVLTGSSLTASSMSISGASLVNTTGSATISGTWTQASGSSLLGGATSIRKLLLSGGSVLFTSSASSSVTESIQVSDTGDLSLLSQNFVSPLLNLIGGSLSTGVGSNSSLGQILQSGGAATLKAAISSDNYTMTGGSMSLISPGLLKVGSLNIGSAIAAVSGTLQATALVLTSGTLNVANGTTTVTNNMIVQGGNASFGIASSLLAGAFNIIDGTTVVAGVGNIASLSLSGGKLTVSGALTSTINNIAGGLVEVLGLNSLLGGDLLSLNSGGLTLSTGAVVNVLNSSLVGGTVTLLDSTIYNTVNLVSSVPVTVGGTVTAVVANLTNSLTVNATGFVNITDATSIGSALSVGGAYIGNTLTVISSPNTVISGSLLVQSLQVVGGKFVVAAGGIVQAVEALFNSDVYVAGQINSASVGNTGSMTLIESPPDQTAINGNITNDGVLTGKGTINGTLVNNGEIGSNNSATTISTTSFTNTRNGKLKTSIDPSTGSQTYVQTVNAVFAGQLLVTVSGTPADGSSYVLMDYENAEGDFDQTSIVTPNSDDSCAAQPTVTRGPTQLSIAFAMPSGCNDAIAQAPGFALSTGALAGIIVGGVALLVGLTLAIIFGTKSIRQKIMPWQYRG